MKNKKENILKEYKVHFIIVLVLIVLLILFFHFLNPPASHYKIYENVCHNETQYTLDANNSMIYPQYFTFQMAPNEVISKAEIISYLYNENYGFTLPDLKAPKFCFADGYSDEDCYNYYYSNYINFTNIQDYFFSGDYIRDEGDNIQNLKPDVNTANVTLFFATYEFIPFGEQQVCQQQEVNSIDYNYNIQYYPDNSCPNDVPCGMIGWLGINASQITNSILDDYVNYKICNQINSTEWTCGNYTIEEIRE